MRGIDGRIFVIVVLASYLISVSLTWPRERSVQAPVSTRIPQPTFDAIEQGPDIRVVLPTDTPRPKKAAPLPTVKTPVATIPSPIVTTPTLSPPPPTIVPSPASATHVVQLGENLIGIAQRYGTTVQAIVEANRLPDPDRILADQTLVIPLPVELAPTETPSS